MFFKLGLKDFKRTTGINLLVIMLLVAVFLIAISLVSAIQVKLKKYSTLSQYLNQKGVYIESLYLQKQQDNEIYLLRDEKELKEYLPNVNSILSVENVLDVSIKERNLPITLWCYSEEVVNSLSPSMESGRWFQEADMDSDILKAVVTYNEKNLKCGDIITLENGLSDSIIQVEIIGIMEDNESLFYTNELGGSYGDYRDCYYTYNYEAEEQNVLMIIADQQILNGEKNGKFSVLNYRLQSDKGFQKQMMGGTLITYNNISQKIIDQDVEKLKQNSFINQVYDLSKMNQNSWKYILEELYNYLPVFICIFIFVIIAAVSANVITVKKQLKNYSIYYICGLPWKSCARISLCVACITSGIALSMVILSVFILKLVGIIENTALNLGIWQLIICGIIILCYILLAWSIPLGIVRNTSAKKIMTNNY